MFRRKNGDIAELGAAIERIEAEIATVERAGPPLEARQAEAVAKLEAAARHFHDFGFAPHGIGLDQRLHYLQMAMTGALMTIGGDQLRATEKERVTRVFQAAGGLGLSEAEKAERLAELRVELRKLNARREVAWREAEGAGAIMDRPGFDPELFLSSAADLQRVAERGMPA